MGRLAELSAYLNGHGEKPDFEYVSVCFDKNGHMYFRVYYSYYIYYDIPYEDEYVYKLFKDTESIAAVILLHRLSE